MHIESVYENGSILDVGEQNQLVITESPSGNILTIGPKDLNCFFKEWRLNSGDGTNKKGWKTKMLDSIGS